MINNQIAASELLQELAVSKKNQEIVSFQEICDYLSEKGFAILMILFALPMTFPIPTPPGFTTALGLPLLYLSWQMVLGKTKPTLPNWIANKTVKTSHLISVVDKFSKILIFLEKLLKPRLNSCSSIMNQKTIGYIALLCSISISLPIVFGNAIPSIGILVMFLGLLSCDGLIILIGMIISIIGVSIASLVVYLLFSGAKLIADGSFLELLSNFLKGN